MRRCSAGGLGVDAERAQAWVELAAERIAEGSIPLCVIPGAADDPAIDIELTAVERNPVNVDGMAYPLPGGLTLISDSCRLGSPPVAERLVALRADDATARVDDRGAALRSRHRQWITRGRQGDRPAAAGSVGPWLQRRRG